MRAAPVQCSTSTMDEKDGEVGVKLAAHGLPREPPSALLPSAGVVDVWKNCAVNMVPSERLGSYQNNGDMVGSGTLIH